MGHLTIKKLIIAKIFNSSFTILFLLLHFQLKEISFSFLFKSLSIKIWVGILKSMFELTGL